MAPSEWFFFMIRLDRVPTGVASLNCDCKTFSLFPLTKHRKNLWKCFIPKIYIAGTLNLNKIIKLSRGLLWQAREISCDLILYGVFPSQNDI